MFFVLYYVDLGCVRVESTSTFQINIVIDDQIHKVSNSLRLSRSTKPPASMVGVIYADQPYC